MLLAHSIRLDPDSNQREYFARAAGTARRVWNWALAEWNRVGDIKTVGALVLKCKRRARTLSDVSFCSIRRQIEYKAVRYGTKVVVADRWFPSSKLCSSCGHHYAALTACERNWTCAACGEQHDRDHNAAKNLHRLATGAAYTRSQTALPVASQAATSGVGEVTPARHEYGQQDGSGQEEDCAHNRAHL